MIRVIPALMLATLVAAAAAGCGGGGQKPYTAAGTVSCLRDGGFTGVTTAPARVGLVAASAENGGLVAASPSGNTVTVAFTAGGAAVKSTEKAFERNATGVYKRRLRDVMREERNAVLVWTVTPTQADENAVVACLAP